MAGGDGGAAGLGTLDKGRGARAGFGGGSGGGGGGKLVAVNGEASGVGGLRSSDVDLSRVLGGVSTLGGGGLGSAVAIQWAGVAAVKGRRQREW